MIGVNPATEKPNQDPLNKPMNIGNVYGTCVGLLKTVDSKLRIYEIKPAISGWYGSPIRILTTLTLRRGSMYSVRGYLDTIQLDDLTVPVLMVSKLTEFKKNNAILSGSSDDFNRVRFASFVYVNDLEVVSISNQHKEAIITLRRDRLDSKYLSFLKFVAMTTSYSREQAEKIKVGQRVAIFGTIHRLRKYDEETRTNEIGVKIMAINPDLDFVDSLVSSLPILHTLNDEPRSFEHLTQR